MPDRDARLSPYDLERPIVQAPLGGGPSTPALSGAVSAAGGLGFLAAGYKTADAARAEIAAVRERTDRSFGIGVFVPTPAAPDADDATAALERYAGTLSEEAEHAGVALGTPRHDDDDWADKLELLAAERPAVASFTFGCPPPDAIVTLQRAGVAVWVTVTTVAEARAAQAAGADALVVQGVEAGGHRGTFDDGPAGHVGLLALLQLVDEAVDLPLVATGGIATGRGVGAVLAGGAAAAQLGTAFMRTPEAGTAPVHRTALARDDETALTRAFTGRTARGIVNRFLREHGDDAPDAYPAVHHLTAPVRAAGRERGDAEVLNLWAGQAHVLARDVPAGELVARLDAEARAALREAAERHPQSTGDTMPHSQGDPA